MQYFKIALLDGNHSDITVKVKEKEFKLHKVILAACSPYFHLMLKNDIKEKCIDVTIEDCEETIFHSFTYFL